MHLLQLHILAVYFIFLAVFCSPVARCWISLWPLGVHAGEVL